MNSELKYIIHSSTATAADHLLGGKAKALAALQQEQMPVPAWFVVTPHAFLDSLTDTQRVALSRAPDAAAIRKVIAEFRMSDIVNAEIDNALRLLCQNGERVAVRSSASDEDGAVFSFAGQLDSFLFVAGPDVADKVAAVWRSGFSERIIRYRAENGLDIAPRAPAALVQRMINADTAGVAFGADPVSGRRSVAVVSAVFGLGNALASGETDADTWQVSRDGEIIQREIACKTTAWRCNPHQPEGISAVVISDAEAHQPVLSDAQVRAVARLARRASHHFKQPQDIEWAVAAGQLYLLQSRPITTLPGMADPDGVLNLWDNSNIAESYGGVTTPLTFSFARRCYEEVYRQFCRLMLVPETDIARSDQVFRHMLGLIRGRVYYNLLNWYRVLALLPGFRLNRRFMEQMMGVKEGLPAELLAEFEHASVRARLRDTFNLSRTVTGLILNHFRLPRRIAEFYVRLADALRNPQPALCDLRMDELAQYYRRLEAQLLTRWDAPLINDFFAMIFFGAVRVLTGKWCGDTDGTMPNNLLAGAGGIISAEPVQRIREMAQSIADDVLFTDALCASSLAELQPMLAQRSAFAAQYENYLARFGDRCLDELKLESATLHDDPLPLLRAVGQAARRWRNGERPVSVATLLRAEAEQKTGAMLSRHPARRLIFNRVMQHACARVRERENLRFERTRLFGRVRRIFVELGERLFAQRLLDAPRDVFYLEIEEVLGFIAGTTTTTDLKFLVLVRKAEFARYAHADAPADRFATFGAVHQGNEFQAIHNAAVDADEGKATETRRGLGCCPGLVRGRVRVITDPRSAILQQGEILVAERTDPGWIMLFPTAAGLLVERGSLLSHSAIVAREMGIPAIVSLPGITQWLTTGDEVEFNGSTGIVCRIAANKSGGSGEESSETSCLKVGV